MVFSWTYLRFERKTGWLEALHLIVTLGALPLAAYLLAYYPWFTRGHDL